MKQDSGAPSPERRPLPLRRVLVGAFALPWEHRAEVARVTGVPLLAVIACTLAFNLGNFQAHSVARWTLYFLYLVASCWLALSVHRLVLLEDGDVGTRLDAAGLKRLGRFVGMVVLVWLLYAAVMLTVQLGFLLVYHPHLPAGQRPSPTAFPAWLLWIASAVAIWPAARFVLALPAIAVDQPADPRTAWRLSRGNGWKLAVVIGLLPSALKWMTSLLYREGATLVEFGILVVLVASCTIFEVVALSLSYWELTAPASPPTDPPG